MALSKWFLTAVLLLLGVSCNTNGSLEDAATPTPEATQAAAANSALTNEASEMEPDDANHDENPGADADVEYVRAILGGDGTWTFHVTVRHPDTGWDDYSDGWNVVTEQGEILKKSSSDSFTRLLLHPHESEQPFTRSQGGIVVPEGVTQLVVRAHDIVDGFGGAEVALDLSIPSGPGYVIEGE